MFQVCRVALDAYPGSVYDMCKLSRWAHLEIRSSPVIFLVMKGIIQLGDAKLILGYLGSHFYISLVLVFLGVDFLFWYGVNCQREC